MILDYFFRSLGQFEKNSKHYERSKNAEELFRNVFLSRNISKTMENHFFIFFLEILEDLKDFWRILETLKKNVL